MNEPDITIPVPEQDNDMPERGYVINKGMPRFVGQTEIRRLSRVVDEKNALIEKFKKYDEERKAYYAERMEEYNEMKETFDQFSEELMKVVIDGDMSGSEHKKFVRLYGNWLTYKNNAKLYKNRIASAKQGVKDLMLDIKRISEIVLDAGDMELMERLTDPLHVMQQHLETVRGRLLE